jgi:hypothetical protein
MADTRKMPRQDIFGAQEMPEQLIGTSTVFLKLSGIWADLQLKPTNMSCVYNMTEKARQSPRLIAQDVSINQAVLNVASKLIWV